MRAVVTLAAKDLRVLLRDRVGFFFIFFFPLLIALFFGTVFSSQGGGGGGGAGGSAITVTLFDEDGSAPSAVFVADLEADDALRVVRAESREAALDRVRSGSATACIIIPEGFGEASTQLFWGDPRVVQLGVDPSRHAEAGMLEGILMQHAFAQVQSQMSDTDAMLRSTQDALASIADAPEEDQASLGPLRAFLGSLDQFLVESDESEDDSGSPAASGLAAWEPVQIESLDVLAKNEPDDDDSGPPNAYAISFPQGAIWGILGAAAGFGISLVTERTRGTLVRLQTAPIRRRDVLAGKALACFVTIMGVLTVLMLLATAFGVRPRSVVWLAAAMVCAALAFVGVMMLLSVLGRTEAAAGGIGWAVLLVMAMIGGGMIPLFIMPEWMRALSAASPVSWAILALERALWRPATTAQMLVPCAVLLGVGGVCFTLGAAVFRRSS